MEILKKDIIKEIKEKSRENLNRGIDIAVSILKHEFPFITGWDYKNNPETYRLSIYLVLMADMNLASEFYNSPIRNVYKHSGAKVAYPFTPLEISTELNEEEKYELFKLIQNSLKEIYDEIPSELRHEFESYSSEKKEPKELYIDGFAFEKPKENINESKDKSTNKLITTVLNTLLLPQYEHVICGFEYKEEKRFAGKNGKTINSPSVTVTFIGGYGTRMWPITQAVQKMHDDVLDEIWETVWDYTGIAVELHSEYVEECEDEDIFLNESEESKQEIKFTKLLNNIEEYLNSNSYNSVVRFMVDYDEVMDDVIVNIFFDAEHAVKLGGGINTVIKKTEQKLMEDLIIFPFDFKYHIHFEKPQLNESKSDTNYIPIIEEIIEPFKNEDCVCEINVLYDEEDDMYSVYLVFSAEELNDKFYNFDGNVTYRNKLVRKIKAEIKAYLPIDNLYVGSYGKPHCGWKPLNEKHKVSKDQYVELYRDKDFVLTIPLTHEASKKYGSDTKWCTTTKECSKKFEDHKNLGILGYITVRDNDLKERLGSNAFALYRLYGDDINRTIVFDDQNNEYRNGEQWLSNKFDRFDKLSEFYKLLREFNRYFELKNTKKESINENWLKVPSSEYNSLRKIINLEMKEKYSWWKDIKINTLNYIELYGDVQIDAELTVDEEWGANQWGEFYYNTKFPGNKGWEDNDGYNRLISLGDIIDSTYAKEIRDDLREILKYTLNIEMFGMSFTNVYLIFE